MASEGVTAEPDESVPSVRLRRDRLRLLLIISAAVLVIGGGLLGVLLATGATTGRPNTPTTAVRDFLQAGLVDHDPTRAQAFACPQLSLAPTLRELAGTADPTVRITWGVLAVTESGSSADASVEIRSIVGQFNDVARWHFGLIRDGEWKVCSVTKDASLKPQ